MSLNWHSSPSIPHWHWLDTSGEIIGACGGGYGGRLLSTSFFRRIFAPDTETELAFESSLSYEISGGGILV